MLFSPSSPGFSLFSLVYINNKEKKKRTYIKTSMENWDCSVSLSSLTCEEEQSLFDEDDDDEQKETEHEQLFHSDDEYIEILVSKEITHLFFRQDSLEITDSWLIWARSDSIHWIMKTRAYFSFSYQTAYLAVTYYDRFLMQRTIEKGKSWAAQLLSMACLSLAAKMEECIVPPLSEYPFEECKFDSNTVQRMELLILSTLEWCMSSITPFSYMGYFISKLQVDNESKEILSKSIAFIFAILDDVNLVDHRPSTIAAAAVLAASNQVLNKHLVESKLSIFSSCGTLNPEHVLSCYTMMIEGSQKRLVASSNSSSVGDSSSLISRSNKRRLQLENSNEK